MNTKFLLLLFFLVRMSLVINSQTSNPFQKLGYDVLVATSSKGEFEEFHDQTDLVEIGSVLFDTKTKQIVKVLDEGETSIDISPAIAAMSIDPLCEKYYWISPYVYCANNPIKFVDPDGRKFVLRLGGQSYSYSPKGGVVNLSTGKQLLAQSGSFVSKVIGAYNKLYSSGDATLTKQINTLVNSDNIHYIDIPGGGSNKVSPGNKSTSISEDKAKVKAGKGIGTTTNFNLSDKEKARLKASTGVSDTDATIVGHELQHQYDFDQGKMSDSNGEGAKDPAEQRAVNNENRVRKIEGSSETRTKYGGEEIDPNKLK